MFFIGKKEQSLFPYLFSLFFLFDHCDHRLLLRHNSQKTILSLLRVFDFASVLLCLFHNEPCPKLSSRFRTLLGRFDLPRKLKVVTVFFLFFVKDPNNRNVFEDHVIFVVVVFDHSSLNVISFPFESFDHSKFETLEVNMNLSFWSYLVGFVVSDH